MLLGGLPGVARHDRPRSHVSIDAVDPRRVVVLDQIELEGDVVADGSGGSVGGR